MLQKLHIQNYAIIDDLTIQFADGLNIITGETGAGKSILMGALNLILGQRADTAVLQDTSKKCMVEGCFNVGHHKAIQQFLEVHELDMSSELLVRREIGSNGKSRSFVNDTPVNLTQLKQLATLLVDLHQQFDTLDLGEEDFQRQVIDALADNHELLKTLHTVFNNYSVQKKLLEALQLQQTTANKELDYNKFLFDELDELSLKENELEQLDEELKLLNNAEHIKQQLAWVYNELKDGEQPLVQQLRQMQHKLSGLLAINTTIASLHERMKSVVIELQDVADELEHVDNSIGMDPQRIQQANDRLSEGYKMFKKHGVNSTKGLLELQHELQQKLLAVLNLSTNIEQTQLVVNELQQSCMTLAQKISANRKAQTENFAKNVNTLLSKVGMPNARLQVQIKEASLGITGIDEITFLFDANKSNRFEALHKVASGGELSRLMLSVKSLVAKKLQLPTLIFDEIDTGISGEAARQVGIIMKDLSAAHQLISITHQPQIAAKAAAHFFVYKQVVANKIVTNIRALDQQERINAIAQMLSGEKPTAAALENAKEMVSD
jgi:DNA repair protein RecN (Recombination protein N)